MRKIKNFFKIIKFKLFAKPKFKVGDKVLTPMIIINEEEGKSQEYNGPAATIKGVTTLLNRYYFYYLDDIEIPFQENVLKLAE